MADFDSEDFDIDFDGDVAVWPYGAKLCLQGAALVSPSLAASGVVSPGLSAGSLVEC